MGPAKDDGSEQLYSIRIAADTNKGRDGFSTVRLGAIHDMDAGVNADRLC